MVSLGKWSVLRERYKLQEEDYHEISEYILEKIALRMAMLNKGGELNVKCGLYSIARLSQWKIREIWS